MCLFKAYWLCNLPNNGGHSLNIGGGFAKIEFLAGICFGMYVSGADKQGGMRRPAA